jgi:hypothetical protein
VERYRFYDLRAGRGGEEIDTLFPGWRTGDERLMVLSPHDDDALLGAGYAIAAAEAHGAEAHVCIYCDGSAGYSVPEDRERIVEVRREETYAAYALLGLGRERVHRLELPDFSANQHLGYRLPGGGYGVLHALLPLLRSVRVTRLLVPNGYREHLDHEATYDSGRYDGVQAGDPVLVDLGAPVPLRSAAVYAVWGDLSPEDALVHGAPVDIRANRAIVADYAVEQTVSRALAAWRSQAQIIEGLLAERRERDCGLGMLELYTAFDPRPRLDYAPYVRLVRRLAAGPEGGG